MYESEFERELYDARRKTLREIGALGEKAGLSYAAATYPNSYAVAAPEWNETAGALIPWLKQSYDSPSAPKTTEELEASRIEVSIAGRVMAIRVQGKAGFAQLQQGGERMQIYVRKDDVGEDAFALYKLLDLGDHIGVKGYLMRTRTGELTVHVQTLTFLTKAMLALPDKYHGLEDTELRYRQRYVDLFMNTGHTPKPTPVPPVIPSAANAPAPAVILNAPKDPAPAGTPTLNEVKGKDPVPAVILSAAKDPEALSPATTDATLSATTPTTEPEAPINVREIFVKRAAILRALRKFFDSRGYLEVETPMLHTIAGGAAARPFKTHHNALDIPLSLRIAPELYLKRLVVGGLDRVYEINRNFRNEGVSTRHNPEFTMLEFYQAYSNYHDLMDLTEELVKFVAQEVIGTTKTEFNGIEIDLGKWTKLSMREAIVKFWDPQYGAVPSSQEFSDEGAFLGVLTRASEAAHRIAFTPGVEDAAGIPVVRMDAERTALQARERALSFLLSEHTRAVASRSLALGKSIAALFEILSEPRLIQPTIIYDFPLAVSPLSKIKPDEPDWVERFEFYIGGFEVGNAFSELNDPDDQRRRFEAQLLEKERGDDEAHAMDEDYVRALGYGLPPTAGEGIGIDRLTMILTGAKSIRDVILFPLLRPQKTE